MKSRWILALAAALALLAAAPASQAQAHGPGTVTFEALQVGSFEVTR